MKNVMTAIHSNARLKWDNSIMEQNEIYKLSDEVKIVHYALKPPIAFMQARDFAEKRIFMFHNESYYVYISSIPNTEYKENKGQTRCQKFFECSLLRKENNEFFLYTVTQANYQVFYIICEYFRSWVYHQ